MTSTQQASISNMIILVDETYLIFNIQNNQT